MAETTANTNSSKLLSLAKIQARIAQLALERAERTQITADRTLKELARWGYPDKD